MAWLDLRTGYRCNNRCRFCDQGDRRERLADAPLDALVAVLARERATGADGVWLAGGEVTLRPDLPRLVEAARAAGYARVGLQTNGRILAAAGAAERLRAAGLTDAVVAVHAATPALHDWLVQEPGAHKQATVGLRRLVAAGVATRVSTVLTRSGTAEIGALAATAPRWGVDGHRWILARPEGAGAAEWRMLVPRLALVRGPVVDAVHLAWGLRREADTVGLPLCVLGDARAAAADRLDAPSVRRAFPPGLEEPAHPYVHGPPCAGCPLRAACPGVGADYAARFGWDEVLAPVDTSGVSAGVSSPASAGGEGAPPTGGPPAGGPPTGGPPPGGPPPPRRGRPPATAIAWVRGWAGGDPVPAAAPRPVGDPVILAVEAACPLACPGCDARAAYGAEWPTEPERALRQRLVRAASEGAAGVVFAGASPWSHPGLPAVIREARRLGFARIEVWGPIEPLDGLPAAAAEKLAGLTRIRAPRLGPEAGPGAAARFHAAAAWLAEHAPGCAVEVYAPHAERPGLPLYQAAGARAVWAPCQRPPAG